MGRLACRLFLIAMAGCGRLGFSSASEDPGADRADARVLFDAALDARSSSDSGRLDGNDDETVGTVDGEVVRDANPDASVAFDDFRTCSDGCFPSEECWGAWCVSSCRVDADCASGTVCAPPPESADQRFCLPPCGAGVAPCPNGSRCVRSICQPLCNPGACPGTAPVCDGTVCRAD
ncbi:MAG: hypothetical protein AAGF12_21345 [Myxococcota bacterium]